MFENFPYTDMHQLNLDWIVKIAKDFLDQYTHIQQLIENGEQSLQNLTEEELQQLDEKAAALEALLQQWYNTHSTDIATQLANAITEFNEQATLIGAYVIASIPPDYEAYAKIVNDIAKQHKSVNIFNRPQAINGYYSSDGFVSNASWKASPMYITIGTNTKATCHKTAGGAFLSYYDEDLHFISTAAFSDGNVEQTLAFQYQPQRSIAHKNGNFQNKDIYQRKYHRQYVLHTDAPLSDVFHHHSEIQIQYS